MDYVVGSVAALISGNVTPNRPKLIRRALTPTKHQASPNVTPKSEFVDDRSIFLSPTQQKKKAIVKKSPKRIFQNPDLDITEDCEGNSSLSSPKAEKVKKHLKEKLEADDMGRKKTSDHKSPSNILEKSSDEISPKKKSKIVEDNVTSDSTPKKKNKKRKSESNVAETDDVEIQDMSEVEKIETPNVTKSDKIKSPKKKMQQNKLVPDVTNLQDEQLDTADSSKSPNKKKKNISNDNPVDIKIQKAENNPNEAKKNKKRKKKNKNVTEASKVDDVINSSQENKENKVDQDATELDKPSMHKGKKKNRKNKPKQVTEIETVISETKTQEAEKMDAEKRDDESESDSEEVKSKNIPNPNAITQQDSDSEHDSDDEMKSENEEANNKILTNENDAEQNQSSDEEEKEQKSNKKKKEKKNEEKGKEVVISEEEIKRTLFVGNVPFNNKCKKEIKKIFNKYGEIETIRIRTIPVKDARVTPKLAVIKNELHPERTTVNVYVKYADPVSVSKAIAENNTVLNGNHLRVSRSASTGAEHDPHCAVFIGNLPFAVEDEMLRSKFEKCGEIDSVRIIRDKKTNAGKGFGYVNFSSKDGVELALALTDEDLTIKNRIIRVKRCTQGQSQGKRPGGGGKPLGGGGKWNQRGPQREEAGAARRILHKRKQQEGGGEGPPHKRQYTPQPGKDKKPRKEFVGMTAEKKKKQKFDKGLKKKKALGEILTKKA